MLDTIKTGQLAAVDADKGTVILDPDETIVLEYQKKSDSFRRKRQETEIYQKSEGRTLCGEKIDIGLNISGAACDELSASEYTDSVGVFRTEFIYMGQDTLPTEDEQFNIYKKVLESFGERPVILRTLDIGGDKRLSCISLPQEENPFLGIRALRFCFDNPDIFLTQIRACIRASVYGNLWLMLPMISSLDDIRRSKKIIESCREELEKEGKPCGKMKIGIMIEVPSIALISDLAAKEVDFASIGSNDLCQYLCAADRMNVAVEPYYQSYHPGMLKLMKEAITAFNDAEKPISICGELAGDPKAVPLLIGMGLRKLSVSAASVASVKRVIAGLTVEKSEQIAKTALGLSTAAEIEQYLAAFEE
jgi:phosphotransferase system enzyme I (PtsI)